MAQYQKRWIKYYKCEVHLRSDVIIYVAYDVLDYYISLVLRNGETIRFIGLVELLVNWSPYYFPPVINEDDYTSCVSGCRSFDNSVSIDKKLQMIFDE